MYSVKSIMAQVGGKMSYTNVLEFVVVVVCCVCNQPHYLSLAWAATSIIFVATNTCLSRHNTSLSRQNYACRDKTFVATKLCLSQQNTIVTTTVFVTTKVCCYKSKLVATKMILVAAPASGNYPPPRSYFSLGPWGHLRTEHLPSLSNPSLIKTEYKIKEHFKSKSLT